MIDYNDHCIPPHPSFRPVPLWDLPLPRFLREEQQTADFDTNEMVSTDKDYVSTLPQQSTSSSLASGSASLPQQSPRALSELSSPLLAATQYLRNNALLDLSQELNSSLVRTLVYLHMNFFL